MAKIKVGFSKSKKRFAIFSWLIRLFQKTPFSHVYLKRDSEKVGTYIYHASGAMVIFMGLETFESLHETVEEFEFTIAEDKWNNVLKNKLIKYAGKPYSMKQIVAILLAEKFNIKSKCLQNGEYAFVCSEIIVEILDEAGIIKKEEWGKSVDLVTPKDIYNKLKELKA